MKNRKLFVRASKKCMVAIMSAMFVMTPVCASVVMPIGSYAELLADNLAGETVYKIEEGDTMENNYGIVVENFGTIENNMGEVRENAGTVNDNWGEVKNADDLSKPNLVVNNHTPGNVIGGNVTNNYGTVSNANVTNDNITNDPHPTAPLNVKIDFISIEFEEEPDTTQENQNSYNQLKDAMDYAQAAYGFAAKIKNMKPVQSKTSNEYNNASTAPNKIDMGRYINFNDTMLEALGGDTCKSATEIHFFHEGKDYYLVIPYGASLKAAYDYVKANGVQGFMCIHGLIEGSQLNDKPYVEHNDSGVSTTLPVLGGRRGKADGGFNEGYADLLTEGTIDTNPDDVHPAETSEESNNSSKNENKSYDTPGGGILWAQEFGY